LLNHIKNKLLSLIYTLTTICYLQRRQMTSDLLSKLYSIIYLCYIYLWYFMQPCEIVKNRIPKESPTRQNCKMLQARFDWACSWTVLSSANYRPCPLAPHCKLHGGHCLNTSIYMYMFTNKIPLGHSETWINIWY
jgi:hypothetical protein